MNVNMKKIVSLSIFLLLLAGCTDNTDNSVSEADAGSNSNMQEDTDVLPEKFDEEVTLTLVKHLTEHEFKDGESIENNVHTEWAKEKFNLNLEYLWVTSGPADAFTTKMRLALSANEELPTILSIRDSSDQDLISSGKFIDAGVYFDKYASDTWKEAINYDPTVWYPYMRDGNRIGIPIVDYAMNGDPVLFIREDWMQNLGLEAPETIEDLETIMDAFVNEDPDGNGNDDTYGLTIGFANNLNTWMSDTGWVFGAYGAMPNQWNLTDEGTLVHGSIEPGIKDGLETLARWMDEGYIHAESGIWDEVKATELFTSGKAGIIAGPHWMPHWPLNDLLANVEGAEYKPYPIPSGPDGLAGRHGTPIQNGVILINEEATEEQIKAFFVYQNYLFDHYANPEAGGEFEYGFAEGYDYILEDGEPIYGDNIPDGAVDTIKYTIAFDGARIPSLTMETLSKLARGEEPETPYEIREAKEAPDTVLQAAQIVLDQEDIVIPSMFTGAPTPTMEARGSTLDTMAAEAFNKIIYGQSGVEEFDDFVENWKSSGGDDITKEVNEWYDSVK